MLADEYDLSLLLIACLKLKCLKTRDKEKKGEIKMVAKKGKRQYWNRLK